MEVFLSTLSPMAMLFFFIAVGFVLSKAKIFSEDAGKVMAKMETWIFCPALSFMTMVRFCTMDSLATYATDMTMGAITIALAMAIGIPLAHLFIKEKCPERGVYEYALVFANVGYVGDPIVLALFGEAALAHYKFFCLPLNLVIYTWGISVLTPKNAARGGILSKILNAPTIAMFAGMAVGLLGWGDYMPSFIVSSLDSLKVCMGPIAMLLAGVTVARYNIGQMLMNKKVYVATGLRLFVIPSVLTAALFGIKTLASSLLNVPIDNNVLFLCFFATAAPLGLNTVVFPEAYGGNPKTGASMAMISHTLCVISIPIMYAIMVAVFGAPFAT